MQCLSKSLRPRFTSLQEMSLVKSARVGHKISTAQSPHKRA